jgi:hypothetical protein
MGVDLAASGWRVLAASVAGTSHAAAGEPCADSCAVRVLGGPRGSGTLVAVAADGAGASPRAAEGARLACLAIVEEAEREGTLVPGFARADAVRWVEAVRRRIAEAAAEHQDPHDFSCTLLVALVGARRAFFFQIGDGVIVYRRQDGGWVPALWPQTGEYANTTWFVTDRDAETRLQTAEAAHVDEVALLTDGLQSLALRLRTREVHEPFFTPMFERLRGEADGCSDVLLAELRAFLQSAPVNRRTDDDKTLVLASRASSRSRGTRRRRRRR